MEQTKLGESTDHPKRSEVDEFKEKYRDKRDNLDEVRHIEGFPVGEDEDIHGLSDPPYYTAYPNPHIKEFIETFGKPYDEKNDAYDREPFVGDVREGKHDPVYGAHTFHTKVPHKAIMKFIKHYTNRGDCILDGFCGSGMTGVAAQVLGRNAILIDLSPIATFIACNCNYVMPWPEYETGLNKIIQQAKHELGWVYKTANNLGDEGTINYIVWSDVFKCTYCGSEIVIGCLDPNVRPGEMVQNPNCPYCGADIGKKRLERIWIESDTHKTPKQVPIWINYNISGKRYQKTPDHSDKNLIRKTEVTEIDEWVPIYRMPDGYNTKQPRVSHGFTHVQDFFTKRNLMVLAKLRKLSYQLDKRYWFIISSVVQKVSKLMALRKDYIGRITTGTLYVAPIRQEVNVFYSIDIQLRKFPKFMDSLRRTNGHVIISTQSATDLKNVPDGCIDYIFTDPPYGGNLMYSELNYIWESWLKVFTNNRCEAIINQTQNKNLMQYQLLMEYAFREYYRILKPGRWMTIVFHNSKASVWNAIHNSIAKTGFVVAQVAVLDKKSKSFKQATSSGAVGKDLVINVYKPKRVFSKNFLEKAGYGLEWEFIEQHLDRLPIDQNIERTERMLYSKMLAYYIQHGYEINMNAKEFYSMLREHCQERDDYWFMDNQVDIYEEKKRRKDLKFVQATLFISDERSAIQWLNWFLLEPKGYDEIYLEFVQVLTTTADKIPELRELLGENFVSVEGNYRRPRALEKEEIEERRNKRLLREFERYLEKAVSGRKLDSVRKEVLLTGFILCYQKKRFQDILTIAKRIPRQIIESNTEIYDLIDVAETKIGDMK